MGGMKLLFSFIARACIFSRGAADFGRLGHRGAAPGWLVADVASAAADEFDEGRAQQSVAGSARHRGERCRRCGAAVGIGIVFRPWWQHSGMPEARQQR